MALLLTSKTVSNLRHGSTEILSYLANPKDSFPHIPQVKASANPHFVGSATEFLEHKKKESDADLFEKFTKQMSNKVRVCTCGKPVAFTLSNCNSCGLNLTQIPITTSTNIFSSFIYGVKNGPFPYTISMRHEDESTLVFDDLLALTPAHLNVIPTDQYIPDWRYLCNNPRLGLRLLDSLYNKAWKVISDQFLGNEEWKNKIINGADKLTVQELEYHLISGCNYPPSQYQFHIQFMLPPFVPHHWFLYLKGMHFTYERFFPMEYIRAVLSLNVRYPTTIGEDTRIEDIISFYNQKGVNYDKIWKDSYARYAESHKLLSNWVSDDFDGIIIDDILYQSPSSDNIVNVEKAQADIKNIQNNDKMTLQNYGRPYNDSGRTTGGYYSFARDKIMPEPF